LRCPPFCGLLAVTVLSLSCRQVDQAPSDPAEAAAIIRASLPPDWRVAENQSGQIPRGHHWGQEYKGPIGVRMVVVGPRAVNVSWRDSTGGAKQDPVASEALELWLMPGNYGDSWKSAVNPHAPVPPEAVIEGAGVKVYAQPGHWINSKEQFKKIMESTSEISWPSSPANGVPLSWTSWKSDLRERLARVSSVGGR
jgi:hypothetical protein